MKPIERSEILPIGEYETIRPHFRARVIEEKKRRRVPVGDVMSAVFENRDSVLLQIQEMLRTERITNEPAIGHELETYNEMLPGPSQLSVTMFVEIPEKETRDRMLVELAGLEDRVALEVAGQAYSLEQKRPPGYRPDRTTAVHYFKVTLPDDARKAIVAGGAEIAIVVNHPRYEVRSVLSPATKKSLAEDLMTP